MPFAAQLPPISWVFPYFFPLFREPTPYGCPEIPADRQAIPLSSSYSRRQCSHIFFRIPLEQPISGNSGESCCPSSIPGKHFPLTARAQNGASYLGLFAHLLAVFPPPLLRFLLRNEFHSPLPRTYHECLSSLVAAEAGELLLFPSHSGSPPTKGTLARNLQKF